MISCLEQRDEELKNWRDKQLNTTLSSLILTKLFQLLPPPPPLSLSLYFTFCCWRKDKHVRHRSSSSQMFIVIISSSWWCCIIIDLLLFNVQLTVQGTQLFIDNGSTFSLLYSLFTIATYPVFNESHTVARVWHLPIYSLYAVRSYDIIIRAAAITKQNLSSLIPIDQSRRNDDVCVSVYVCRMPIELLFQRTTETK